MAPPNWLNWKRPFTTFVRLFCHQFALRWLFSRGHHHPWNSFVPDFLVIEYTLAGPPELEGASVAMSNRTRRWIDGMTLAVDEWNARLSPPSVNRPFCDAVPPLSRTTVAGLLCIGATGRIGDRTAGGIAPAAMACQLERV